MKQENILQSYMQKLKKVEGTHDYKDYLKGFDEEFETHCQERIKETPLLLSVFQEFVQQIYRPSKIYSLALKTKSKIRTEMNKTFTEEQKYLLEQWQYCEDRILDDMIEQAFIYGYAMSNQLKVESIKQYPHLKK